MSTPINTQKYRKLPVEIEAVQLSAENLGAVKEWCGGSYLFMPQQDPALLVGTPEGVMKAHFGDWVVKGVAGEFYPVKDEIFRRTYQVAHKKPTQPNSNTPRGTDWEKDGIGISEEGHIIIKIPSPAGEPEFAERYGFTMEGLHRTLRDHFQSQAEHEELKRKAAAAEPAPKLLAIAKDLDAKAKEAALMADGSAAGHVMSGQRQAYRDSAATIRAEFSIP